MFGKDTYLVTAIPADCQDSQVSGLIEQMIDSIKDNPADLKTRVHYYLAVSLAKSLAVKRGVKLQKEEINSIVESLFSCKVPEVTMDGKPTMVKVTYEELQKTFK